jgi:uncharacterized protein YxjI
MKIPCTNCNQHLEIPEELAGQTIECPACNTSLAVPALVQEEAPQGAFSKNYPIELNFKKIALAKQAMLTDSKGNSVAYARQKVLKLKEELEVFEDKTKAKRICTIKANKVIDFSAAYHFYTENKQCFGSVQRKGLLSIWKATYLVDDSSGNQYATIKEENPFAKLVDSLLGGLPFVGFACNYIFNSSYITKSKDGTELFRLTKVPSFWGALFKIDKLAEVTPDEEIRCMMSLLMMIFLEKSRG